MNNFFWSQNKAAAISAAIGRWISAGSNYAASTAACQTSVTGSTWVVGTFSKANSTVSTRILYVSQLSKAFICTPNNVGDPTTTSIGVTTNGISWTSVTTPSFGGMGIGWQPNGYTASTNTDNGLLISVDQGNARVCGSYDGGTTWALMGTQSGASGYIRGVVWSNDHSMFVGCGISTAGGCVQTSPDGITWTRRAGSPVTGTWAEIAYAQAITTYVITSLNSTGNKLAYSTNGTTWTTVTSGNNTYQYYDVCYSPTLALFATCHANVSSTTRIATSATGSSWTLRTTPNKDYFGVQWSETQQLFVCAGASSILTSTDGVTWTERTSALTTNSQNGIQWVPWV